LITLIQNNVKLSSTSTSLVGGVRRGGVIGAGFNLVLGVLFVMWGLRDDISFITALGAVFVLFGLVSLFRVLRITAPKD
jgi:hypothetical protein